MRRKVQLYIAGRQVDLGDDSFILYNWTREDMANPTSVVNSSSQQIQLPGTCRNNSLFGSAFRLDRRTIFGIRYDGTQFDPTRKTPFMLYADDGTVLESGYCRLDAIDTHSRRHAYTVTLYGGLGSFFYALSSKEDGTPRTLADLTWQDPDGNDITDFSTFRAQTVALAWRYLREGTYGTGDWFNVVNFAPAYNGLPEDFDASHAISDGNAYNNVPFGYTAEDGTYYAYKPGLECCLLTFANPHTEWEVGDLRWYLQRPVLSVKAFIDAICDTRNNGGYTVTLDPAFFRADNPHYADAWWTLPMIATEDRDTSAGIANVLAASKTPMQYLVDFCKIFGLLFIWDSARRSVRIVTRATFYGETVRDIDLTQRVDRSQQITQDPVLADKRWYQLGDGGKGQFVEQYKTQYGKGYAIQRIDTSYEFDAGTTVLTEGNAFQDAAEVQESGLLYATAFAVHSWGIEDVLLIPNYEAVSATLWNGANSIERAVLFYDWYSNDMPSIADDVPEHPGVDWLPKLQLHGTDNKTQEGTDVLLFFSGFKDTPTVTTGKRKTYYLTEDDAATMRALAGGPCWDLRKLQTPLTSLPSFRRVVLSGQYITESWEWGVPAARPVLDAIYPTGAPTAIFDKWWKAYLGDRYAADTRVLTCMADLRGLPVGQALLRRFFWLDGARWVLNAIRNHSFTTWDLSEIELVKVQDRDAYITGPGNDGAHFLTVSPLARTFNLAPAGEALTLTVRSSSAWTLALSELASWLTISTQSGSAGTTVVTITATANTSGTRRSINATLTNNDGDVITFGLTQANKPEGAISVDPTVISIPATGTGTAGQATRGRSAAVTADGAWAYSVLSGSIDWLTYIGTSSYGITVRAGANSGSERSVVLKIYLTGDPDTYCTLTITQAAGAGGNGGITLLDGNRNNSATVDASGASLTLYVTIPDADSWTITKSDSWITVSPVSGSDNGVLAVTIPNYTGSEARQGTITATRNGYTEGAVFYITQNAPAAVTDHIQLTRADAPLFNDMEMTSSGGTDRFDVRASGAWTVVAQSAWIHPLTQYGAWSGSGNATLWFDADVNSGASRTGIIVGTLTATGETSTFYVYQDGNGTVTLDASFSKTSIDSSAQEVYLTIATQSGVAWTIDNVSSGLSIPTLSGTGPATITVQVSSTSAQRTLSARVRSAAYGLSVTPSITQQAPAASDYLNIVPFGTVSVPAATTTQAVSIECSTSWRVTCPDAVVQFSQSTGSGNVGIDVTFPPNPSNTARTYVLTFQTTSGTSLTRTLTIVQAGASGAELSVTPTTVELSGAGQQAEVSLTASDAWTTSKSASWITVAASGQAGTWQVYISAGRNTGAPRTGTVTFTCAGVSQTVTVTQGSDAELEVSDTSVALSAESGSSDTVTVYASQMWDLSENSSVPIWLNVSMPSHAGNPNGETITFTAASANNDAVDREVTLRLVLVDAPEVYQDITITQAGQSTLYVSPATIYVNAYQGSGTLTVTSNTEWHVSSYSEGLHVGIDSGDGDGVITWWVEGNPSVSGRSLTIVVVTDDGTKTATVTINQAGGMLYFEPDTLTLASNGESAEVTCVSSDAWTLDTSTVPSWLTVTPEGSSQTGTVMTFTAPAYTGTSDRSATVYVENQYGYRKGITVTQRGRSTHTLSVSPTDVHLPDANAATGQFTVTSDTSWTIEVDTYSAGGLTVSASSGTGNRTLTWSLPANSYDTYTEHVIKVRTSDGALIATLSVWQPPRDTSVITVQPDTDSLTFYADAPASTKTFQIRVLAMEDWTAYPNGYAPWCVYSGGSGQANVGSLITFTPTISTTEVQTVDFVIETTGGYTRTITITTLPSSD